MRDTTNDAEQVQLRVIREMPPAQRLRQVLEWSEQVRRLAVAGLRERHPDRTDSELIALAAQAQSATGTPGWPRR